MEAEFVHGTPLMVEHTPAGIVAAGAVVVVGDLACIAHRGMAAGQQGSLAQRGGVYRVPKATGSSTAIVAGKKVWWDNTNNVITTTASTHKLLGYTVTASLDADTHQLIEHQPGTDLT